MVKEGRKLTFHQGKWYLQDLTHGIEDWNAYLPSAIRKELQEKNPELFPTRHVEISDRLLPGHIEGEPEEQDKKMQGLTEGLPDTTVEQLLPPAGQFPAAPTSKPKDEEEGGTNVQPLEFILHDTARRALESVWVLEGFNLKSRQERHELPFAFVDLDAKGNPQRVEKFGDKSELLLSLADLSVYFLIDCYMKFQKADETIVSLNVEKTMLYNAYMQEKLKREQLDEAMTVSMFLNKI